MIFEKSSNREMTEFFIKTARVQLLVLGLIMTGFTVFGREFVILWLGKEFEMAWFIGMIIMIPLSIPLFQSVGVLILQAKNLHAFRSLTYLAVAFANIGLSIIFTQKYGMIGTSFGTIAALIIGNILVINIYYHIKLKLDMVRFFKEVLKRYILLFSLVMMLGYLLNMLPKHSWFMLVLKGSVYVILFSIVMWMWGLNEYEKGLFSNPVRRIMYKYKLIRN